MARFLKYRGLLLRLALLAALAGYLYWGNATIGITELSVPLSDLPEAFDGYRIVQVSDLHNAQFGPGNRRLLTRIRECRPDLIVLTGDIIDSRRTDVEVALEFVRGAVRLAPTYYVTGNHEGRVREDYERLKSGMTAAGAVVLEGAAVALERSGASVTLLGLQDPAFTSVQDALVELSGDIGPCTILLAHHPELVGYYAGAGVDLVFSGHAHGGQFRLPFVGGLIAPGQGWLPAYDAGLYTVQDTQMIVSRGLGNSVFPFRLNNRPELVAAELTCE